MKRILTFLLLAIGLYTQAQTQNLCAGDTQAKRYWVTNTTGSSYQWMTSVGSGMIISGQGTHEVQVQWSGAGTATLEVVETNGGNCVGEPVSITINFGGPTAELQGLDNMLCDVPSATGFSVALSGNSPWDISYTVNGEVKTATGISTSPYPIEVADMAKGNTYTVALTGVSDNTCPGSVVGGTKSLTIHPEVSTSAIQFE